MVGRRSSYLSDKTAWQLWRSVIWTLVLVGGMLYFAGTNQTGWAVVIAFLLLVEVIHDIRDEILYAIEHQNDCPHGVFLDQLVSRLQGLLDAAERGDRCWQQDHTCDRVSGLDMHSRLYEALECEFNPWNECQVHNTETNPRGYDDPHCDTVERVMDVLRGG